MPLIKVVKVASGITYGLWEISEEIETLLEDRAFTNHENVSIATLHPKKQLEYVTSRILIARLCEEVGQPYTGLVKDEFGKPHLRDSDYHLSLSHSFPFAIAILNEHQPTGIDIEYPNAKIQRISSKFINEAEQRYNENITDLCKIWCIKETLYKIYGRKKVDYKKHLHVDLGKSHDQAKGVFSNGEFHQEYDIKVESHEGFVYCYNI